MIQKDKEMTKDKHDGSKGGGRRIIWSANNPSEFTFEVEGQSKTVCQYFEEKYSIRLRVSVLVNMASILLFGGSA